uniref:atlastin-2-like n=1 Tax=Styela clava TaxID=7725 RepID=UPI00193A2115|nr:atlastin-2-like [Styela clava]XP_039260691.1 atlastin-2-like [Styela clava]
MACGGKTISSKLYNREDLNRAQGSIDRRQSNSDHKLIPIAYDEDGHLQLNLDALKRILSNPLIGDKPISIISVAGQYRTGKSFLLNFFIRYLRKNGWKNCDWIGDESTKVTDGIDWEKGTEAHTKGILMWPEIFVVEDCGNDVVVLLMDTQGLFDTDTGSDTNARILSVSTLLSSHQILNIMNRIEERDLEHLQLCSIHAKAATREVRKEIIRNKPFQTLSFLVRDWQYEFEHKYGDGGMNYLDGILNRTSKSTEVNNVKKSVRDVFSNVQCFLMPHPGDDVLTKSKINVTNEDLDEDFMTMVQELATKVLHPKNLVIKKIEDETLTGNQILELMSTVSHCFNQGQLPEIRTLYEEAAHSFSTKVMQASIEKYKVEIEKSCKQAIQEWKLANYHEKAIKNAKRNFQQNATFGSDDIKINYLRQTELTCNEYLSKMKIQNSSLLRKQTEVVSGAKERCLSDYQSNMNKVFRDEALSHRDLQMFHDKHREAALQLLRREVASLISDHDQILEYEKAFENKINQKYHEFQLENQRNLDLKKRQQELTFNEHEQAVEEFLQSICGYSQSDPAEWERHMKHQFN